MGTRRERNQITESIEELRWWTIGVYEHGKCRDYQVQARTWDEACEKAREEHEFLKEHQFLTA